MIKSFALILIVIGSCTAVNYIGSTLYAGQVMNENDALISDNNEYTAVLQGDGNFVVYKGETIAENALFETATNPAVNPHPYTAIISNDGSLQIKDNDREIVYQAVAWKTGGTRLVMQDDGNLVIYNDEDEPTWASNTNQRK